MAYSSLIPVTKDGEYGNWAELPSELTSSILSRLDPIDILENAQKVCTSWRGVCKDPAMWRKIKIPIEGILRYNLEIMCRHAVDRSQGGLVEIDISCFGTNSLLNYVADSSTSLRSLKVTMLSRITTEGITEALGKLPLLEELEVTNCRLWGDSLKVVGQSCPKLKTLKLDCFGIGPLRYGSDHHALAISETIHRLRDLQLVGNRLTDAGLNAILDNCPDLDHLDLRHCCNVNIVGELEKRCYERIKVLIRPYEFPDNATVIYIDI